MKKQVRKKKKRIRLRYGAILVFALFIYTCYYLIASIFNLSITNIYVLKNELLTDQEIIEMADIDDYPSTFKNSSKKLEKRLEESLYIEDAKVYKKGFTQVYIEITENYPIFYYDSTMSTILKDGESVTDEFIVPTLVNYVPDTLYNGFVSNMSKLDKNILSKISEIKYDPNEVDDERFLLYMNDNNLVYLTLSKFSNINSYLDIVVNFEGKKGILYLDSGNYFEIIE